MIRLIGVAVLVFATFHWVHLWRSAEEMRIDEAAIPRLSRLLKSNDAREWDKALKGFSELGERGAGAVPELDRQLQGGNVRAAAALSHIGAPGVHALIAALGVTNRVEPSRKFSLRAFGSGSRWPKDLNYRERIPQAAMNGLIRLKGTARAAVPALVELVNNARRDPFSRQHALTTLGMIGEEPELVAPLVLAALGSSDTNMVRVGTHAVRGFRSATNQTVPALMAVLRTNVTSSVQRDAGDALVELGAASRAVSVILARLDHWDGASRTWAAEILGSNCPEAVIAVPSLGALLDDSSRDVRMAAVRALGVLCPRSSHAIAQCLRALHDRDQGVVEAAIDALGGEAARWGNDIDYKAECAMRRMGSFRNWRQELVELQHAPDAKARRFAAWLLASFAPIK